LDFGKICGARGFITPIPLCVDAGPDWYIVRATTAMNAKLLFKMVFLILVLLVLVMMGMNNRSSVAFVLPPLIPRAITQPAAIMYFAFFAIGVLTGTVLTAGGGGGRRSSASSKSSGK
jgi:uncharacterized integral membrane protein